jgi:alkanesulfonate monooxygenase SsuD/methylene tetrahydromethanopterin reductase-like flavin-dependent oxidoreductase (luciferase family)
MMTNGSGTTRRPFRFGVVVTPNLTSSSDAIQKTAQTAAGLGYSIVLAPDRLFLMSPLAALATAAASADIRVGTFVMSAPLRTPAVAAWEANSLNSATGGRFELGIGAGLSMMAPALQAQGIDFGTPGERVARVEETVRRAKAFPWAQLHVTLAAGGPKMRELAGRVADTAILTSDHYMDVSGLETVVSAFRAVAGERADDIELGMNLLLIGDKPVDPAAVQMLGLDAGKLIEANAVSVLRGSVEDMCSELVRRRDLTGLSYLSVSEPMMEQFAPVVQALSGR